VYSPLKFGNYIDYSVHRQMQRGHSVYQWWIITDHHHSISIKRELVTVQISSATPDLLLIQQNGSGVEVHVHCSIK